MSVHTIDTFDLAGSFFAMLLVGLLVGASIGGIIGTHAERAEWVAGRSRVVANHSEAWRAPLKPGDAGWWEKP